MAKKKTTERKPAAQSLNPQNVDRQTWYYEERKGICVVRQIRSPDDELVQADMFYLPWRKIEASVKRWRAAAAKRRK